MSAARRRLRYGRFRGGPDPLAPPADLRDALDAIGREVMEGRSPEAALREFLRQGGGAQRGLDDLARDVHRRRQELLRRNPLGGTLDQVRKLLKRAVDAERAQLDRASDDDMDARFARMRLDNLPASPARAVDELSDHQWRSPDARRDYEQIRDLLGREALDQRFAGMKQALENASDADRAAVQEMVDDLNRLLTAHANGGANQEQFEEFMRRHGDFFPGDPQDMDELVDQMAQRAAAAQRMMNSMTPEQRAELAALSQQAFGSPELNASLGQMDSALRALRPGFDWSGSEQVQGDGEGLGLGEGTQLMQDLGDLDELADQLAQMHAGAQIGDVDLDALARQLGDEAAASARTLAELERTLRNSGYLTRGDDGALRLSPRAMRRLGASLLRDVARRLGARPGSRDARRTGQLGEPTGASRAWEFGDTEPWDTTRTVLNAVSRQVAEGRRPGDGTAVDRIGVEIDDVEVVQTEARTRAAVALLVDTSFSMVMEGRWVPMRRTALALHHLVSTRFRGDHLELVGFGLQARSMEIGELTALEGTWEQGTNLHHALMLANRHFRKHPNEQPVLLVVTDGEPTAHLEAWGQGVFHYPPDPRSLALTVAELDRSAALGARITFFRLGDDPALVRFLDQMARRVGGSVVAPDPGDLGAEVVDRYLDLRRG